MSKFIYTVDEANKLINEGKKLVVAGSNNYLKLLDKGNWIGGTSYYCISEGSGIGDKDFLFIQEIPQYCEEIKIIYYDLNNLKHIYADMYDNGFSVIIIPYESKMHFKYPVEIINYPFFATKPLIGWIAGIKLNNSTMKAFIYDGSGKDCYSEGAIVMHVKLPENKLADVKVCNIFEPAGEHELEFLEEGFNVTTVSIDGEKYNFVDYIKTHNIDIRFPIVGTLSNAIPTISSFKAIDEEKKIVKLYAPVYKGIKYDLAKQSENYFNMLIDHIPNENNFILPYLCILHFIYGELDKKCDIKVPDAPTTFGEIAHVLVNQTLTYLTIYDTQIKS
jgi:hypothetical protein